MIFERARVREERSGARRTGLVGSSANLHAGRRLTPPDPLSRLGAPSYVRER